MPSATAVARFIDFYKAFDANSIGKLNEVYSENVEFQDPARRIEGLQQLQNYFSDLLTHVHGCHFEIGQIESTDALTVVQWKMHFIHDRLNKKRMISVDGVSIVSGSDKIERHRDYFDLGELLYEHVPVIGSVVRFLKRRLSS